MDKLPLAVGVMGILSYVGREMDNMSVVVTIEDRLPLAVEPVMDKPVVRLPVITARLC